MTQTQPMRPAPATLDAPSYVPGLITWLANKLSAGASQLYRKQFDLGVIDWRVLATIASETVGNEAGATGARICQVVGLDKAAVSRSFGVLTRRGLIRLGKTAGRARLAELTPAGRAVHDAILQLALARQARLLEGFSDEERRLMVTYLHRLLDQVAYVNAFTSAPPAGDGH
jgi:DNA-binding MarR family transcriptional regulator